MTNPVNNDTAILIPLLSAQPGTKASSKSDDKDLEAACRDFESLFVNYLMQKMRDTVPDDSLFGGGQAEKIYTGMLDNEVAKSVSQHRGIGLAAMMYAQMSSTGENDDNKK
jgi:flagellar protein FlgJ